MRKLKANLRNLLKKESTLIDAFLLGSALKGKEKPNDIDIITLFRDKNLEKIEDINYKAKKLGDKLDLNLHIEPIIVDNLYEEPVYISLLHEGFSIRKMKYLHDMLNFKSYLLIKYNLMNKNKSDKVRFSYALYGRKNGQGVLKGLKGMESGRGSILVPVEKQHEAKEFFRLWNVEYREQRIALFLEG